MTKSGTVMSVLLLACMGIVVIALAEPIAGQMMGQGGMMGQGSMMAQGGMMGRMVQCEGEDCEGMMAACPANRTCVMVQPMTGACPEGRTCYVVEQLQNASDAQARLDCARIWLEKAMNLHDLHLRDPTTTTDESQIELMDQITRAYECVTGENMTSEMMNTTADQASA
ncbi:MAG TPA: hypothetical protein VLB04_05795 [Methanotrichaceae archaeon]|nr:hypothetical protein [Methanotrichaceae archaeon]